MIGLGDICVCEQSSTNREHSLGSAKLTPGASWYNLAAKLEMGLTVYNSDSTRFAETSTVYLEQVVDRRDRTVDVAGRTGRWSRGGCVAAFLRVPCWVFCCGRSHATPSYGETSHGTPSWCATRMTVLFSPTAGAGGRRQHSRKEQVTR